MNKDVMAQKTAMESTVPEGRVPIAFVKALLVQARSFGKDVQSIVDAAGFPFNPLQQADPGLAVSVQQYSRLCMELFEALGDESGGIIPGMATPLGATRMLAYSMLNCRDLEQALERAIEFNEACREGPGSVHTHRVERLADEKTARLAYLSDHGGRGQDAVLCSMAVWLRFCSWLIGYDIEPFAAGCAGPTPENRAGLQHFFSCPVSFKQSENWIDFAASYLKAPIVRSETELEEFLKVAPYHVVIKPVSAGHSVAARVRELMAVDLRQEMPEIEELSQSLNMSTRTLRRRLEKEGTSYQRVKDTVRRDAAIRFLANPELSISDVAELVGFSDTSAFHRAFRRWTGQAPGNYRGQ